MNNNLFVDIANVSGVFVNAVVGTTINQIGDAIPSEVRNGTTVLYQTNYAIVFENKLYVWVSGTPSSSKVYEFVPSGETASITYDTGSAAFQAGDTVTGATSGQTATVARDTTTGDTILAVTGKSGAFTVTETITGPSGVSATLDSAFSGGGDSGYTGSWSIAYSLENTIDGANQRTGLYLVNVCGITKIVGAYETSNTLGILVYDPIADQWSEYIDASTNPNFSSTNGTRAWVINNQLVSDSASNNFFIIDPLTKRGTNTATSSYLETSTIMQFNGEYIGEQFSFNANGLFKRTLNNTLTFDTLGTAASAGLGARAIGNVEGIADDKNMYLFFSNSTSGLVTDRSLGGNILYKENDGSVKCSNIDDTTTNVNEVSALARKVFGSGFVGTNDIGNLAQTFIKYDGQTNVGSTGYDLYIQGSDNSAIVSSFTLDSITESVSDQGSVTYVWDGTTTITYSPTTSTVVAVNDLIARDDDPIRRPFFRVTSASGGIITIENPNNIVIPSGVNSMVSIKSATSVGSVSVGLMAKSIARTGGSEYSFVNARIDIKIVSAAPLASNQMRLSYICYSPSGTQSVSVQFAYGDPTNESLSGIASLTNPSSGSISGGNTVTGITANNATEYTVDWTYTSDSLIEQDNVRLVPSITAA